MSAVIEHGSIREEILSKVLRLLPNQLAYAHQLLTGKNTIPYA